MIIINTKNYMVWGVVAIVVVAAIYFFMQGYSKPSSSETPTTNTTVVEVSPTQSIIQATTSGVVAAKSAVDYTDNGFTPKSITVKVGTTVTWTNKASDKMWVASAPHPTHTALPGFDELSGADKGGSYSYTFTKVGNWKYHNHLDPKDFGAVVVE